MVDVVAGAIGTVIGFSLCWLWNVRKVGYDSIFEKRQKQTYIDHLDRVDYFCQQCGTKQRGASDLVRVQPPNHDSALNICYDCLSDCID